MKVSILDYGAVGDGVADCYKAFQDAEDELKKDGGEIYVPSGRYLVSKPFYHWSNITLSGDGKDSVIFNDLEPGDNGDDNFCILIGNFKPSSFGDCIHYDIKDVIAGDDFVKFTNKKDMNGFVDGECVLIDSISGFMGQKGKLLKPYVSLINRVEEIDKENSLLYLEDAINTDIIGAKIARAVNDNSKDYICQFPIIHDIAFESKDNWTLRFGVYKGIFKNLWIKSTDVIGANGLARCSFENITSLFSQKVLELATYSHDTTVTNLIAKWYDGHKDPDNKPLLKMGENIRNCTFDNLQIDAGEMKNIGMIMRFEHAFENNVVNSSFTAHKIPSGVVEFTSTDDYAIVTDNNVSDNKFYVTSAKAFVIADVDDSRANITSNYIVDNEFHGSVSKNESGNVIELNEVSNTYN